jgi:phosphonopyruvate decarboxylase
MGSLEQFLQARNGPALQQLKIKPGVPEGLPRPSVSPVEVKQRLMRHLDVDVPWTNL